MLFVFPRNRRKHFLDHDRAMYQKFIFGELERQNKFWKLLDHSLKNVILQIKIAACTELVKHHIISANCVRIFLEQKVSIILSAVFDWSAGAIC